MEPMSRSHQLLSASLRAVLLVFRGKVPYPGILTFPFIHFTKAIYSRYRKAGKSEKFDGEKLSFSTLAPQEPVSISSHICAFLVLSAYPQFTFLFAEMIIPFLYSVSFFFLILEKTSVSHVMNTSYTCRSSPGLHFHHVDAG